MTEIQKNKPVVIVGAGGHAKVLIVSLKSSGRAILGLLTPDEQPGTSIMGVSVLGDDSCVHQYDPVQVELVNGIGSYPGQKLRWRIGKFFREKGYEFSTVIHESAVVSEGVILESGVQIMAGCILQPGTRIGVDAIINTGTIIDHDCLIGKSCHIAPGCTLSGGVKLGDSVHLGTGSCVIQQVSIGKKSTVAAGSTIYSDIDHSVKVIQTRKYQISKENE